MTTMVKNEDDNKLTTWLDGNGVRSRIGSALGGVMDEDSFIAQIVIAMQHPDIRTCTVSSQFEAVHLCASLGLLPSLQQVALIPRDMKSQGRLCTVMPQWQGYHALMIRHPDVLDINARLVHVTDDYEFDPITESLSLHDYDPFDATRVFNKFEDVKGGYLVVTWRDKERPAKWHFVPVETMKKAKACAQTPNIWNKWFTEMCLKTVYRNAYARRIVPIDPLVQSKMEKVTEADDVALGNDPERIIDTTASPVEPTRPKTRAARLVQSMGGSIEPEPGEESQEPTQDNAGEESQEVDTEESQTEHTPKYHKLRKQLDEATNYDSVLNCWQAVQSAGETITEEEYAELDADLTAKKNKLKKGK